MVADKPRKKKTSPNPGGGGMGGMGGDMDDMDY
jgi:hypothetical protein